MLILTRRVGETLMIGPNVTVTVLGVKGNQVRVGVSAPKDVRVGDPVEHLSLRGSGRNGRGRQQGYAAPVGTGPESETCGSCRHIFRSVRYRKCKLMRNRWTGGFKTDILARSPACKKWEAP